MLISPNCFQMRKLGMRVTTQGSIIVLSISRNSALRNRKRKRAKPYATSDALTQLAEHRERRHEDRVEEHRPERQRVPGVDEVLQGDRIGDQLGREDEQLAGRLERGRDHPEEGDEREQPHRGPAARRRAPCRATAQARRGPALLAACAARPRSGPMGRSLACTSPRSRPTPELDRKISSVSTRMITNITHAIADA